MKKTLMTLAVVSVLSVIVLTLRDDRMEKAAITFPNGIVYRVDVADDQTEQTQGLSDLTTPQSMLFLFKTKSLPTFWMKNMHFAIDIIWLEDHRIVGFEKKMLPENPAQTFYRPKSPVNAVLEVPAGMVDKLSLEVGDQLDITWNPL